MIIIILFTTIMFSDGTGSKIMEHYYKKFLLDLAG